MLVFRHVDERDTCIAVAAVNLVGNVGRRVFEELDYAVDKRFSFRAQR